MKMRILAAAAIVTVSAVLASSPAAAAPIMIEDASPQEIVGGMSNKVVRGITNVATGWGEFPKQIYLSASGEGGVKGFLTAPLKGIGMTVVRTVAGALELVTFFLPYPGFYDPIVPPEFVWQKE